MSKAAVPPLTLAALKTRQAEALGWAKASPLVTPRDAERFLARYGVVLRYGTIPAVPLASLRIASGPANMAAALEQSIHLTNHLLATSCGIEVNVVANRLAIVHRALMPSLYCLVRRNRPPTDQTGLSLAAQAAYGLIVQRREVSAGMVRKHLGVAATPRHDPAYAALAELQRQLLVDRGPFEMAQTGIPYLSKEGYPYHLFHEAHADLVRASVGLSRPAATDDWLATYVQAAAFGASRTLATLFRLFLTPEEIEASTARLVAAGRLERLAIGRSTVVGPATSGSRQRSKSHA